MRMNRTFTAVAALLAAVLISGLSAQQAPPEGQAAGRRGGGRGAAQEAPAFKKLTRAEFDALLQNPAGVLVLDVRRPDELTANGGFPVYLSIQAADLEKSLAFIPKDRAIITVSNRAARAGRAAALLEKNGFTVAGGIGALEYEAEGGTLAKIAPPAPRGGGPAGGQSGQN